MRYLEFCNINFDRKLTKKYSHFCKRLLKFEVCFDTTISFQMRILIEEIRIRHQVDVDVPSVKSRQT